MLMPKLDKTQAVQIKSDDRSNWSSPPSTPPSVELVGYSAAVWEEMNQQLYEQLGRRIPDEAVREINRIHAARSGGHKDCKAKRVTKILLAIRDGIDWRWADGMEIKFITEPGDGGEEVATNLKLVHRH